MVGFPRLQAREEVKLGIQRLRYALTSYLAIEPTGADPLGPIMPQTYQAKSFVLNTVDVVRVSSPAG